MQSIYNAIVWIGQNLPCYIVNHVVKGNFTKELILENDHELVIFS